MQEQASNLEVIRTFATAASVIVAAAALGYAWYKERLLKRREFADRTRHAAALLTAKLERWSQLALRLFEELQPLITETDVLAVEKKNVIQARDYWQKAVIAARANVIREVQAEQIELSYAELYGYNSSVRELFTRAVGALRQTDERAFKNLMDETQKDILGLRGREAQLPSAELGNLLRATCKKVKKRLWLEFEEILSPVRQDLLKLIDASDGELFKKRIKLSNWDLGARRSTQNQKDLNSPQTHELIESLPENS